MCRLVPLAERPHSNFADETVYLSKPPEFCNISLPFWHLIWSESAVRNAEIADFTLKKSLTRQKMFGLVRFLNLA